MDLLIGLTVSIVKKEDYNFTKELFCKTNLSDIKSERRFGL